MDPSKVDAFALFKSELNAEQLSVKVNAVRRLPIVINSTDTAKTVKSDILKFLAEYVDKSDDDEVLYGLSVSLGECAEFFRQDMLPLLEKLLSAEETVVRDKAIGAFVKLVEQLSKAEIKSIIVPFVVKLASSDKFSQKMSALNLIAEIYPLVAVEDQSGLLDRINAMFTEESLILRRNLASKIGVICKYVPKETLVLDFFNQFKTLALDDSDSVRILCIESLVNLSKVFNDEENKVHIIPIIITLTGDKSWRVRFHLAQNFAGLAQALGKDIAVTSLISIFSTLLKDLENEVRIAAVNSLKNFVSILTLEKLPSVLAYLQTLSKDSVALVRVGVCDVLSAMFAMDLDSLSKDVIKSRIQPIIQDLVNDTDLEVKISALSLLKPWAKHVGTIVLDLITSGTLEINMTANNWRIRCAELECLMELAKEFNNIKIFDKSFKKYFFIGLNDKAYKVRQMSVSYITAFGTFMDDEYFKANIIPPVIDNLNNPSLFYTYKVSALYALEALFFTVKSADVRKNVLFKQLVQFTESKFDNLRLVALKVLIKIYKGQVLPDVNATIDKHIRDNMISDEDREIKIVVERYIKGV